MARPRCVCVFDLAISCAVEQFVLEFRRERFVWKGQIGVVVYRQPVEHVAVPAHGVERAEHLAHGSIEKALVLVCDYSLVCDSEHESESAAVIAGAVWSVEGEHAWLHLFESDSVFRAGELRGVDDFFVLQDLAVGTVFHTLWWREEHAANALALFDGELERLSDTTSVVRS